MSNLCREDFDSGPKHMFHIEDGLWLGNYELFLIKLNITSAKVLLFNNIDKVF